MTHDDPTETSRTRARDQILSDADREAAARLRSYWDLRAKRGDQTRLAEQWHGLDGEGITQGAISQYLSGLVALNAHAVIRFADFLGIDPLVIRCDLPELRKLAQERLLVRAPTESAPQIDERLLDARWKTYSPELKAGICRMVESARATAGSGAPENHEVVSRGLAARRKRMGRTAVPGRRKEDEDGGRR